jgi:hypothetical protein
MMSQFFAASQGVGVGQLYRAPLRAIPGRPLTLRRLPVPTARQCTYVVQSEDQYRFLEILAAAYGIAYRTGNPIPWSLLNPLIERINAMNTPSFVNGYWITGRTVTLPYEMCIYLERQLRVLRRAPSTALRYLGDFTNVGQLRTLTALRTPLQLLVPSRLPQLAPPQPAAIQPPQLQPGCATQVSFDDGHRHMIYVPREQNVFAMYPTSVDAGHRHAVQLTDTDVAALRRGRTITKRTTQDQRPGGRPHTHSVTINCVAQR